MRYVKCFDQEFNGAPFSHPIAGGLFDRGGYGTGRRLPLASAVTPLSSPLAKNTCTVLFSKFEHRVAHFTISAKVDYGSASTKGNSACSQKGRRSKKERSAELNGPAPACGPGTATPHATAGTTKSQTFRGGMAKWSTKSRGSLCDKRKKKGPKSDHQKNVQGATTRAKQDPPRWPGGGLLFRGRGGLATGRLTPFEVWREAQYANSWHANKKRCSRQRRG